MTPTFTLPSKYATRPVQFVLSRERNGWRFFGRDVNGACFAARNSRGDPLCSGCTFKTKAEAAIMASALGLPAYSIWNGRTGRYDGAGTTFTAYARDYVAD